MRPLVDPDTPESARTRLNVDGRTRMNLVFSDEFNVDGRSFYPGDDPYWVSLVMSEFILEQLLTSRA